MKLSDKSQITSYIIAELVAMKQQPHTIAESHILPACCEIAFFRLKNGVNNITINSDFEL